jgi:hypothetical protein
VFTRRVRPWSNPTNPTKWDICREGRQWSKEEFDQRIDLAPEKIAYFKGIFGSERERLNVLGMLSENFGIDKVIRLGRLEDWKAAVAEQEKKRANVT